MDGTEMKITNVDTLYNNKYIKVYNTQYDDGHNYYITSRRNKNDLKVLKDDYELMMDTPDAVSCFVVIADGIHIPKLILQNEYRHPLGRYVLGVPAGLIEKSDRENSVYSAIKNATFREIYEEIGIDLNIIRHRFNIFSYETYSSPGFTDESNAIVTTIIKEDIIENLNHNNAEINEHFGKFKLVSYHDAKRLVCAQNDLPLMTYVALLWFVSMGCKEV